MIYDFLIEICSKIGFSVCHQIPERTIFFGNIAMPICSRCTGIYIGFTISIISMIVLFRKKESGFPPLYIVILSLIFIISTVLDGIFSYLYIYNTNNIIRIITGYMFGTGIALILYPVFPYQFYKESSDKKIFSTAKQFIFFMIPGIVIIGLGILRLAFLGILYYYLSSFSVIFTFVFPNLLLALLFPRFSKKSQRLFSKYLTIPLLIGFILALAELSVLWCFHLYIIKRF